MPYSLVFPPSFRKDARGLDNSVRLELRKRLEAIEANPFKGKPLHGRTLYFSERMGNYRILYYLEGEVIHLVRVAKRDVVYKSP